MGKPKPGRKCIVCGCPLDGFKLKYCAKCRHEIEVQLVLQADIKYRKKNNAKNRCDCEEKEPFINVKEELLKLSRINKDWTEGGIYDDDCWIFVNNVLGKECSRPLTYY